MTQTTGPLLPTVDIRRHDERFKTRLSWLDSKNPFSFSRHLRSKPYPSWPAAGEQQRRRVHCGRAAGHRDRAGRDPGMGDARHPHLGPRGANPRRGEDSREFIDILAGKRSTVMQSTNRNSGPINSEVVMAEGLRERLIGAWKLVSYQEIPVDGSDPFEPLGHQPHGIIMYTPDGYMSAQLSKPDRPNFTSGDWFAGTPEDYQQEATSYIAYSGPFHVDEDKQTLTHSMFVSLFPNWTGQTQPRQVKLEGHTLHLGTAAPIQSSGKTVNSVLIWRRADPN